MTRDGIPEAEASLADDAVRQARTSLGSPAGGHLRAWLIRRLLYGLLTLLLVSILVFLATQVLPGDAARAILGRDTNPTAYRALRDQLGLNRSVIEQYGSWIANALTGDFGTSLISREPVANAIADQLVNSTILVGVVFALTIPFAFLIGSYQAYQHGGRIDGWISIATLALASLPEFVIGVALVALLATNIVHVFPAVSIIPPGETAAGHLRTLVLPAATLFLVVVPYLTRIVRATMIEVFQSDYVHMARLKGLPERSVIVTHALRNALVPAIQVSAVILIWLAGGIVVIEYLFNYPGVGRALVDAVASRDLPVVQAVALLLAASYVIVNLIADALTVLVSPRLRTGLARR